MTRAKKKVEGGKLIEVRVEDDIRIFGDFFMHPEEEITRLETVVAENVDDGVEPTREAVETFLREDNIDLLGVDADDIAETAVEAYEKAEVHAETGNGEDTDCHGGET